MTTNMIVQILNTDETLGIKKGQIFEAKTYWLDPEKITLIQRLTKKDMRPIGKPPECNQYLSDVKLFNSLGRLSKTHKI